MKKIFSFIFLICERKVNGGDYEAAHYDNPFLYEDNYDVQDLYDDVPDLR